MSKYYQSDYLLNLLYFKISLFDFRTFYGNLSIKVRYLSRFSSAFLNRLSLIVTRFSPLICFEFIRYQRHADKPLSKGGQEPRQDVGGSALSPKSKNR